MAHKKDQALSSDRVERLLGRVILNRRRYTESIRGEKVLVRPSIPKGGVVDFEILGSIRTQEEDKSTKSYTNSLNLTE